MFFATTASPVRRHVVAHPGRTVERFIEEALQSARNPSCAYTQDETSFQITLDMPGIGKEQLSISIEGATVRLQSKEGAPRSYRAAYEFPQDIDSGSSEAKLENGVLTLRLAKKLPVSNATELTIL